jgi:hypothetical protein
MFLISSLNALIVLNQMMLRKNKAIRDLVMNASIFKTI